jgi:hypothetical protein
LPYPRTSAALSRDLGLPRQPGQHARWARHVRGAR